MSKTESTPDARFTHLVKRALFELRLAGDIARADAYDPNVRALIAGARSNLRRVLQLAGPASVEESGVERR
jgi:hypothetical protein